MVLTKGAGSLAESDLSVLSCQCLDRRIPHKETPTKEVGA
jgi:hypothetical protein